RDALVANERDALDAHLRVLRDGEADADLVVLFGDHLARGFGEEITLLRVLIADLLDSAAERRAIEHRVLFDLDGLSEIVAFDLLVPLELDDTDRSALLDVEAEHHAVTEPTQVDF